MRRDICGEQFTRVGAAGRFAQLNLTPQKHLAPKVMASFKESF